ncbi:MAG TPA: cytochrome c [Candidatus Polarisedimenticolia bacterium]|nr:cytochrome c [Candidatus Polarisedimenticolia bacterium]
MKNKWLAIIWLLALISAVGVASSAPRSRTATEPAVYSSAEADAMRLEGEKRFRANCNRCHAAPHKFPPRMMATMVRHMRVRATITDEDMRYILYYMTQ